MDSKSHTLIFKVVPCVLFQSVLYCSNSCTSLHFKTLKSHSKTLKIYPNMFQSLWNHPQEVHGCTLLGYWIGMLICTHTHTHRWNKLTYSHIPTLFITNVNQHSNSVT